MTVPGMIRTTSRRVPEWVDELGVDEDDRGFFRWTSEFLTGRIWTMVVTDTCDESPGSCP